MRGETGYYCQVTHATESLENKDAKQTVQTFTLARTNKALPRKRATVTVVSPATRLVFCWLTLTHSPYHSVIAFFPLHNYPAMPLL